MSVVWPIAKTSDKLIKLFLWHRSTAFGRRPIFEGAFLTMGNWVHFLLQGTCQVEQMKSYESLDGVVVSSWVCRHGRYSILFARKVGKTLRF